MINLKVGSKSRLAISIMFPKSLLAGGGTMDYTIGEVAKIINISPHTLRFYDKEGLLPFVERSESGIRRFKEEDFGKLMIIECLKKTGMPIKDIKTFIDWWMEGDSTIEQRLEMFRKRKEAVERQIAELQETLELLNYKCWYYETAKAAGTCAVLQNIAPEDIPEEVRTAREKLRQPRGMH